VHLDSLEVTISMVSGSIINWLLTMAIFGVSVEFAIGTTAIFFCVSYARSYVIRRIFRRIEEKKR
jgi:O-antigen/teichoic acid export membrane protein